MNNKRTVAVVLAAGSGNRFHEKHLKQFECLNNKPVILYSIEAFENSDKIDSICIVVSKENIDYTKDLVGKYNYKKINYIIPGGNSRFESVYSALNTVKGFTKILFHDAARPLLTCDIVDESVDALDNYVSTTVAVPSIDTSAIIKKDGTVQKFLKRSKIWNIQTPQGFQFDAIFNAYNLAFKENRFDCFTDDCGLLQYYMPKVKIKVIKGTKKLMKLTFHEDIKVLSILQND